MVNGRKKKRDTKKEVEVSREKFFRK